MKAFIYKLHFTAPIQISSDPLSLEKSEVMIHSDTLFSAIANSYAMLFNVEESFFRNPPFSISSAFPFYNDTLFIKPPYIKWNVDEMERQNYRKKIKKCVFISLNVMKKIVNNEKISLKEKFFALNGFFSEKEVPSFVYSILERPHSSVSNLTGETHIFYTSSVSFSKGAGLYFLVKFKDESEKKHFDAAIYLLSDTGIGGKRSIGHGMFHPEDGGVFQWDYKDGDYFINLSLYHPTEQEIKNGILENAHFSTINRQNWIFSNGTARPVRSKSVRMFLEESVFNNVSGATGDMVDITPSVPESIGKISHRIYRNGKLFKIPIPGLSFGGEK